MNLRDPDTLGTLDGRPIRLGDVPPLRRAEFAVRVNGAEFRPFRFTTLDEHVPEPEDTAPVAPKPARLARRPRR